MSGSRWSIPTTHQYFTIPKREIKSHPLIEFAAANDEWGTRPMNRPLPWLYNQREDHALLIVFGGLPGAGKSTLARAVVKKYAAVYLRIDTIEMAIRSSNVLRDDVGPAGYVSAYWVAEENLRLGQAVVADSVNALQITRDSWAQVARNALVSLVEVEVVCSDAAELRRRIESKPPDLDGLPPLTWESVCARKYEKWSTPHVVIDTARKSVSEAQHELIERLASANHLSG